MVMILTKQSLNPPAEGQEIVEEKHEKKQLYARFWITLVFYEVRVR